MRFAIALSIASLACSSEPHAPLSFDARGAPLQTDAGDPSGSGPGSTPATDAGVPLPSDAGPEEPPLIDPLPTWSDCRVNHFSGETNEDVSQACEALYRNEPDRRRYGIRWVFFNDVENPDDWTQDRIDVANDLFEETGVSFQTDAILNIPESIVDILNGRTRLSLRRRLADLIAHLDIEEGEEEAVINALKARLGSAGADPERVNNLSGNTSFTHSAFLSLMARAHSESIYLVVGDQPTAQSGVGGFSSPPIRRYEQLQRSFVALKTGHTRLTILAHELGHYFGLKHPHARSQEGDDSCRFNTQAVQTNYRARDSHSLWRVLAQSLGSGFDRLLPSVLPQFDDSSGDLMDDYAVRFALADTWVRRPFVMTNQFEPFDSFADYIAHWRSGGELLQRNFLRALANG